MGGKERERYLPVREALGEDIQENTSRMLYSWRVSTSRERDMESLSTGGERTRESAILKGTNFIFYKSTSGFDKKRLVAIALF